MRVVEKCVLSIILCFEESKFIRFFGFGFLEIFYNYLEFFFSVEFLDCILIIRIFGVEK